MKLTPAEYQFLAQLPTPKRDVVLFLERRLVGTRGLFGILGDSPPPQMSFALPGFDARQLTKDEFSWVLAWQSMGLVRVYVLEPGHPTAIRAAKLGLTHQVQFSSSFWHLSWSLRLGEAHFKSSLYNSQ